MEVAVLGSMSLIVLIVLMVSWGRKATEGGEKTEEERKKKKQQQQGTRSQIHCHDHGHRRHIFTY